MSDTEWFEGQSVEQITVAPYWLLALVILLVGSLLAGCATPPKEEKPKAASFTLMVCYMKYLGQTDEGYTVAAEQCLTPEEFEALQK